MAPGHSRVLLRAGDVGGQPAAAAVDRVQVVLERERGAGVVEADDADDRLVAVACPSERREDLGPVVGGACLFAQIASNCALLKRTRITSSGTESLSLSCSAVFDAAGSSSTSQLSGKLTSGATAPTAAGMTWIFAVVGRVDVGFGGFVAGTGVHLRDFAGVGGSSLMPKRGPPASRTFIERRPAPLPSAS